MRLILCFTSELCRKRDPGGISEQGNPIAHLTIGAAQNGLTKSLLVLTMYLRAGGASMKTRIVRIGNSKGIRLPKPLLEQVGLVGEVDLEVRDGALVISPAEPLRAGWREAAILLAERKEDALLDAPMPTRFDAEEWEW